MTPNACQSCAIRHKALCRELLPEELVHLNSIARKRTIHAGQQIASPVDTLVSYANIISGVVKLSKVLPDGRAQIVGLQFVSDFLGRPFKKKCTYFAQAATEVELCTFSKNGFEKMILKYPGMKHRLLDHTLDELDAAQEWMLLLGRKTAREKLASFLCMVGKRGVNQSCSATTTLNFTRFDLPLTRADIADFLGLTTETVSRQISKFKTEGLIRLEGSRTIVVPNMRMLETATTDA